MRTTDRQNAGSWDRTPFGRLNRQARTARPLTIAEAFAEVAAKR
ncbi:MAG: hypothetical protein ACRDZ3_07205 [Acidimicrobiia bacterium]